MTRNICGNLYFINIAMPDTVTIHNNIMCFIMYITASLTFK